jgi:hypothetical protein
MSRKLKDGWLQGYQKYIVKHESPDIFHFWVGISMISTALRRNVWIDRGAYRVYPNQYIFLISESGMCRKSASMELGLDLLDNLEKVLVLHERMTLEGLVDHVERVDVTDDGKIKPDGSVLIHADELSNLFGKAQYLQDLISFLTAAYTSKAKLEFLTRKKGRCTMRNPCISILAGSTPEKMGEIFNAMTLDSGFMARVILVVGSSKTRVSKPLIDRELIPDLVDDLKAIGKLNGEIKLTPEAEARFDYWYENEMGNAPIPELRTFYERKHDHVFKTAIALSVSESDKMEIDEFLLNSAIDSIDLLEEHMPTAVRTIGATEDSLLGDLIIKILRANPGPMQHSILLRRVYKHVENSQHFALIMQTLENAGRVHSDTDKGRTIYECIKISSPKFRKKGVKR